MATFLEAAEKLGMSPARYALFLAALFLSSACIMLDGIIFPVVNGLYEAYPNDEALVNFIVSGDYLAVVAVSVVAARFVDKVGYKRLLAAGCLLIGVAGVAMVFVEDPLAMCLMRVFQGAGLAFAQVCGVSLIESIYSDERDRASITGKYYGVMYVFGVIAGPVAGNLAVIDLRLSFWTFVVYIPIALMVMAFVPGAKVKELPQEEAVEALPKEGKKPLLTKSYLVVAVCYCLMYYVLSVRLNFTSVFLAENDLGNAADAGYLESIYTIGCCVAALSMGRVIRILRARTLLPILYGGLFLGYVLMMVSPTLVATYVAYVVCGISTGMMTSVVYAIVPSLVPKERVGEAVSYLVAGSSIAQFLTTYIVTGTMRLMGVATVTPTFVLPMAVAGVVVLVSLAMKSRVESE